ncbi:MAG: APC family permease [Phycisphaerae bacterium]|nr:APC family permease [Phycisphaerae bacterium]
MSDTQTGLRANALGLLATSALTAAYMAPALSIYALFGAMTSQVGVSVGFVMLLGMLMTLPSIVSFGMLAKEMPSAGGVYAWARRALGESLGLWVGLATASYYTLTVIFPPIVFGQFFNEVLKVLGLRAGVGTWLLGVVLALGLTAYVTYRGIVVSSRMAFAMLMTELAVVVALAATFLGAAVANHTISWAPISPAHAHGGWSSIFLALPLALLAMVCDAVTPASEETRDARRTIPLAMVMTCVMVGVWYVVGFSAFAMATTPEEIVSLSQQAFATPITPLAERYWGSFKLLVTVTGMTASVGALVPCSTAASRVLFAMGRDGTLPRWLGYVHPRTSAPWHALHVVFVVTGLAIIPLALRIGVPQTIGWWGNCFAWFIAVVYIAANCSNVAFYLRYRRERFHLVWNLVVPVLGAGAQCIVLWQIVVVELWNAGWFGRSSQLFIVLMALATAIYVYQVGGRSARG